ncbi:MAG: carbohydrate kinase family protein [Pyrinomonadaceae bacterium]
MLRSDANPAKIAIIGELNVDLVASGLRECPELGREILADDFAVALGSASAITACGAARLGHEVTFVSRVGKDEFGSFCLTALSGRGIKTDRVFVAEGSKTGVTVVLSTQRDRALVTHLGSIAELCYKDIPLEALDRLDHLHLTSYYLQSALRVDFPRLMAAAKKRGMTTSFDPNTDPEQGRDEPIFEVLEFTDILFLNEPEAILLSGRRDVDAACHHLGRFCPVVVVKLGANGAVALKDGEFVSAGGFAVDAVDTTGAGDSFAAGFIHAYKEGASIQECLRTANACGALSTRKAGGTSAQPTLEELDQFLKMAERRSVAS